MQKLAAIMKTTAARLSALYLLLFAISALILVYYMTSLSERMLTSQTRATVEEEVVSLGMAYERGGLARLVRFVTQRSRASGWSASARTATSCSRRG